LCGGRGGTPPLAVFVESQGLEGVLRVSSEAG
jgi:hypothetical protein